MLKKDDVSEKLKIGGVGIQNYIAKETDNLDF